MCAAASAGRRLPPDTKPVGVVHVTDLGEIVVAEDRPDPCHLSGEVYEQRLVLAVAARCGEHATARGIGCRIGQVRAGEQVLGMSERRQTVLMSPPNRSLDSSPRKNVAVISSSLLAPRICTTPVSAAIH